MLDNSRAFVVQSAQVCSVVAYQSLTRSERAASAGSAARIASGEELWQLSWQLVEILALCRRGKTPLGFWSGLRERVGAIFSVRHPDDIGREAAAGLLARWADLPAPLRMSAISVGRPLLVERALDPEARGARSLARLVADLGEPRGAAALTGMLMREGDDAAAAAEGLVQLACAAAKIEDDELAGSPEWISAAGSEAAWSGAELAELHRQIAAAVKKYGEHRQDAVLSAALVLLDPGILAYGGQRGRDPLVSWFLDGEHEAHMAWRGVIKRAPGVVARKRAWQFLGRGIADSACCERLLWARDSAEHAAVLELGHLALNPDRRRGLERLRMSGGYQRAGSNKDSAGVLPSTRHLERLSPSARLGVARLGAAIELPYEVLERTAGLLAADEDAGVRLAGLCMAPMASGAAGVLCADPDVHVARYAALVVAEELEQSAMMLTEPEVDGRGGAEAMAESPHAGVRAIGERIIELKDPWGWSSEYSRLSARDWVERDRRGFLRALRRRISGGTHQESTDGIMLARRLGISAEFELELLQIVAGAGESGEEQRLAATAVAALGEVSSTAAIGTLIACAGHSVDRVRANAVEAMMRARWAGRARLEARPGLLVELKGDRHHRVRANVLRGLLSSGQESGRGGGSATGAREELAKMLMDERPLHRLAGLWALERVITGRAAALGTRWDEMVSLVAQLAREEPEEPVRVRAERCGRLMLQQMRGEWQQRAGLARKGAAV